MPCDNDDSIAHNRCMRSALLPKYLLALAVGKAYKSHVLELVLPFPGSSRSGEANSGGGKFGIVSV